MALLADAIRRLEQGVACADRANERVLAASAHPRKVLPRLRDRFGVASPLRGSERRLCILHRPARVRLGSSGLTLRDGRVREVRCLVQRAHPRAATQELLDTPSNGILGLRRLRPDPRLDSRRHPDRVRAERLPVFLQHVARARETPRCRPESCLERRSGRTTVERLTPCWRPLSSYGIRGNHRGRARALKKRRLLFPLRFAEVLTRRRDRSPVARGLGPGQRLPGGAQGAVGGLIALECAEASRRFRQAVRDPAESVRETLKAGCAAPGHAANPAGHRTPHAR